MRLLVLAIFAAGATHAWVTKSQSIYGAQISEIQDLMNGQHVDRLIQAQLGFLWTYPEATTDQTGLGRGITWAWDPALCELLRPKFREDIVFFNLVTCASLRAAVARAFEKWSNNSPFIKFIDVTSECDKLGLNYGPPTAAAQPSQYPHGGCPLAKIWISRIAPAAAGSRRHLGDTLEGEPLEGRALSEVPIVEGSPSALSAGVAVATAQSHARYSSSFRYTNGVSPYYLASDGVTRLPRKVVETYAGTFSFNVEDVCWYLDSDFCSEFHKLKRWAGSASQAKVIVTCVTLGIMVLGVLVYLCVAMRVVCAALGHVGEEQKAADMDGDGELSCCERTRAAFRELASWNPFVLALFVVLIICPPLLQTQIFAPCFDCHDFEATAIHEIGHFLGLGHPDNIPDNMYDASWAWKSGAGNNSYQEMLSAGGRTNTSNCATLWDGVKPGVDPNATVDVASATGAYPYVNAQMESTTQHNPKTCLTNDDLQALSVLYPDCGDFSLSVNVCHRVSLRLGLVRLTVYVIGPFILGLVCVLLFVGIVHKFSDDERKADLLRVKELEQRYGWNQEQVGRAPTHPSQHDDGDSRQYF